MKKILLPINLTDNSVNAIRYATSLANELQSDELALLHVVHSPYPLAAAHPVGIAGEIGGITSAVDVGAVTLQQNWQDIYAQHLAHLTLIAQTAITGDTKVDNKLAIGGVAAQISKMAKSENMDLIVMGSSANNLLPGFFTEVKSVAVAEQANTPVLVVPQAYIYKPIRNIVYATDYEQEDIASIRSLLPIAWLYQAHIHVIHITDDKTLEDKFTLAGFKESVQKKVNYSNISFHLKTQKDNQNIPEAIHTFCQNNHIDLLALLTRNQTFFEKIFTTTITENMVNLLDIPLIAFHTAEETT